MAKKKSPSKKATPRRPQKQGKAKAKASPKPTPKKKSKPRSKTPWLNSDGTPNKRYGKIAKYLTKQGKIRKGAKLPFKVKTAKALFNKLYPSKLPPWYTKDGKVRKIMLKYLTKAGTSRKGVKLPKGVKTIQQLWDWVRANKVKREDDKLIKCVDITEPYWEVKGFINKSFKRFLKVFMGGRQITRRDWDLDGDDYINEITDWDASPPEATYTICYFKKYKYLFV